MTDTADTDSALDGVPSRHPEEALAGLSERLSLIESRPLDTRAEEFGRVHDELRAVLEGSTPVAGQGGR